MNPHSGFFDLIEKREMIKKEGNRYTYTDLNGEVHKYYRKEWNKNENGIMDLVMTEFSAKEKLVAQTIIATESEEDVTE
jgi:hypothetical protein